MSKFKSLVFIFVVALFIGATTSSADNHGDTKKEVPVMKCGEGKCGDTKREVPAMKCGEGKCGNDTKKTPTMKCGAGKCG